MNYIGREPAPDGLILVGDTNPVGAITWFHAPPDGTYLRLNGQVVVKATYPDLWAWAQNFLTADQAVNPGLYRNVDANTFALPKFDGLFVRSVGQVDANRVAGNLGALQADDNKSHTHTDTLFLGTAVGAGMGIVGNNNAGDISVVNASGGTEARPANVALVACVKALRTVLMPGASVPAPVAGPGQLIQSRAHVRGDFLSASSVLPGDDTIPQITEGVEYLSVANFAPTMMGSRVRLRVQFYWTGTSVIQAVGALFRSGTPDALTGAVSVDAGADWETLMRLEYEFITATLTPFTYSFRAGSGGAASPVRMNGRAARELGGVWHSFLRIDEYSA